ncbi:predicted protein [Naegleria gruberi]|uniref:Predicted protein n=1 Tax=Naegleria gruberi TaxID=5762 RepID=D2UZS3_NAEGR|nr:uncharacterized protein NAEGRDRAFT_62042 [Naegleria gruberi]EFC50212.1 predicted protein [Naegleria gruberi]|eukprot:XP_002682956.1 predicted protein [Naegleria gruberi strain NEG-M]
MLDEKRIRAIIQLLPKIDLHTHIGGCIRSDTIYELIKLHPEIYPNPEEIITQVKLTEGDNRNLKQCFDIFKIINSVTCGDLRILERITTEILEDYDNENTIYLELRTTPKSDANYTKKQYLQCVIDTIENFLNTREHNFVDVGLLVSVNREENIELARETVNVMQELVNERKEQINNGKIFKSSGIVGLDLSGNPYKGNFSAFLKLFEECNMHQTIHFAEIDNYEESKLMLQHCSKFVGKLKFRLGHGVCLNDELKQILKVDNYYDKEDDSLFEKIPVEINLTSNLMSKSVNNLHEHPLVMYYLSNHPISINTDDRGVFQTSLEKEYLQAIQIIDKIHNERHELKFEPSGEVNASLFELIRIVEESIGGIFASESVIENVRQVYKERVALVLYAD